MHSEQPHQQLKHTCFSRLSNALLNETEKGGLADLSVEGIQSLLCHYKKGPLFHPLVVLQTITGQLRKVWFHWEKGSFKDT